MENTLTWKEGLNKAMEQIMFNNKAQIKPRRGITTLLKSARALMLASDLKNGEIAEQSGVSAPVVGRIKKGSLTTIAAKTEVRLRKWLDDNTDVSPIPDTPAKQVWGRVDLSDDAEGRGPLEKLLETSTIDALEREATRKDYLIRSLEGMNKRQRKSIKKLKHQRDKLIEML